jgi:hypothetical protein
MLLNPLEEQIDLPTAAIQLGEGSRRQIGVVRQEDERFAVGVLDTNPAQQCRVVLGRVEAGQSADLNADNAGSPIRFQRIASPETQVRLGANDIETPGLMQAMQLLEVNLAAVHDVESASLRHQHVEDIDLVPLAVADVSEAGDAAPQVEQGMHLHRLLGGTERRPREHRLAQVDDLGIQGIRGVGQIDTKGFVGAKLARNSVEALREVGMDAPVVYRVGVGRGVPLYGAAKTHVIQLGHLTAQAGFNVAKTLPIGQLRRGYARILVEAGEVLDFVFPVVTSDTAAKSGQWQMRHDLRKKEFARVHWRRQQPGWRTRNATSDAQIETSFGHGRSKILQLVIRS